MQLLALGLFPRFLLPRAYRARDNLVAGLHAYHNANGSATGSFVAQERTRVAVAYGFTTKQMAQFDMGLLFAVTTNAVPATFWLICYIHSTPGLASAIRSELAKHITRTSSADLDEMVLDVSRIKDQCPILGAAYSESLRFAADTVPTRLVLEDTILADGTLLRKDGVVQVLGGTIHRDDRVWGPDNEKFVPARFLPDSNTAAKDREMKKRQSIAWMPFGGGAHLCPGRYFAFTEIAALIATMLVGFEMKMVKGKEVLREGEWKLPRVAVQKLGVSVLRPAEDVQIRVSRRKECGYAKWRYTVGDEA
jgi:cytochrome P450